MLYPPINLSLICLGLGLFLELLTYTTFGWQYRRNLSITCLLLTSFGAGMFAAEMFNPVSVIILFLLLYRVVNLLRIVQARMHEKYLKKVTFRSFVVIGFLQAILISVVYVADVKDYSVAANTVLVALSFLFFAGSVIVLLSTLYNLSRLSVGKYNKLSDKDLPTVTLAVSARNENTNLVACIDAALASDYSKLEIIVLDDCSQDKTPEIIKNYAQSGVRFVQSQPSGETWLAKNKAYQTLLEESSGELVLFMGVDVTMLPSSIRTLVEVYTAKKVDMISVLPKRKGNGILASIIQPMRYWWELVTPSFLTFNPPVLSTCWMVNRQKLVKLGGFKSVTRAVIPEEHIATRFKNKYAFVKGAGIGISTSKQLIDQWLTAIRTRYPQLHRRPENVALESMYMVLFLLGPFVTAVLGAFTDALPTIVNWMSLVAVVALISAHFAISYQTNPSVAALSLLNFPVIVIVDLVALNISMFRYEFGVVEWKGRDVTTPAMHVVSHLPSLD